MAERPKLGQLLLGAEVIVEGQLAAALDEQKQTGRPLGMTLVKMGFLDEETLVRTLARQLSLPIAWMRGKKIRLPVLELVSPQIVGAHRCLPVRVDDRDGAKTLLLAMEDPADLAVLDEVALCAGMTVRPVLAAPSELEEAIERHFPGLELAPSIGDVVPRAELDQELIQGIERDALLDDVAEEEKQDACMPSLDREGDGTPEATEVAETLSSDSLAIDLDPAKESGSDPGEIPIPNDLDLTGDEDASALDFDSDSASTDLELPDLNDSASLDLDPVLADSGAGLSFSDLAAAGESVSLDLDPDLDPADVDPDLKVTRVPFSDTDSSNPDDSASLEFDSEPAPDLDSGDPDDDSISLDLDLESPNLMEPPAAVPLPETKELPDAARLPEVEELSEPAPIPEPEALSDAAPLPEAAELAESLELPAPELPDLGESAFAFDPPLVSDEAVDDLPNIDGELHDEPALSSSASDSAPALDLEAPLKPSETLTPLKGETIADQAGLEPTPDPQLSISPLAGFQDDAPEVVTVSETPPAGAVQSFQPSNALGSVGPDVILRALSQLLVEKGVIAREELIERLTKLADREETPS